MAPDRMRTAADPNILSMTRGLVEYVREFVKSRRGAVRDCARYQSVIWLAEQPGLADMPMPRPGGVLLSVDYRAKQPHPQPPQVLDGWLDPAVIAEPSLTDPELAAAGSAPGEAEPEAAAIPGGATPNVLRAYEEWLPGWRRWAQDELAARLNRLLYGRLSEMARRVAQADDIYEVVLGAGLLTRDVPKPRFLSRHVLTRRVSVIIDRATARVDVVLDGDAALRFEDREFLEPEDGYVAERADPIRGEIADQDLHPLSEDAWHQLQRWAGLAFDEAVRCDAAWEWPGRPDGMLGLSLAPAVLLRERDTNVLAEYYDRIAGSLAEADARTPLGLAQLVAPLDRRERLAWDGGGENRSGGIDLAAEALFPLPANKSQQDVLDRMYSDTAVVVQGPPGTGKTHTIANLICAFLSEGRRVLVTSQKEQALRELRARLPEPVQDLCVMLTGVQRGGPDEFERSITALSDHVSSTTPAALERDISALTGQRKSLLSREAKLRAEILAVREAEWTEHPAVAPGYAGTLAAIASHVMTRARSHDWLPPLPDREQAGPPLPTADLLELRALLDRETPARQARRQQQFPAPEEIPDAETFERLVAASRQADELASRSSDLTRSLASLGEAVLPAIAEQAEAAAAAAHQLRLAEQLAHWEPKDWRTRALADRFGNHNVSLWRNVSAGAVQAREAQQLLAWLGQRRVTVPDITLDELAALVQAGTQLRAYLADGGRLYRRRFLVPSAQRHAQTFLGYCRVDGLRPANLGDVDTALAWLRAATAISAVAEKWRPFGVRVKPGTELSVVLSFFTDRYAQLAEVDAIARARDAIDTLLNRHGIRLKLLATPAGWDAVRASIPAAIRLSKAQQSQAALARLTRQLPAAAASDPPELAPLRQVIQANDTDGYRQALASLVAAADEQRDQQRCDTLLERLRKGHPEFAQLLAETAADPGWADRLRSLPEAWSWRIAWAFCQEIRDPDHDRRLQRELDEAQTQLSRVTVQLLTAQAWLHCLHRMTQEQQSALQSYRTAIGALGKGTGQYAARHRRAARSAMNVARGAVPAWIMPLPRVAEQIPAVQDAFDVVIVDEASQAGLGAVFLLWLAPRVIAVGDDKQCAPFYSADVHERHYERLAACLPDLTEHERHAFRPDSNLYEILSQRFPDVVRLSEHFRCMPEIIGWSSRQFYDNRLVPLRQFGADRLSPLQVVHVQGSYTEGRRDSIRNETEAKQLVEKLRELLDDPEYRTRTFGIITLQGTGQARLIETMIVDSIDPTVMERHQIKVGTPPDFQGAERDVTLLSMVVAEPRKSLTQRGDQRRFNVAASRARDQMWLFTSAGRNQLSRHDLRFSLLDYMEDPPSHLGVSPALEEVPADESRDPFDSLFEQRVFRAIRQRGYHVIPQLKVDKRYIDLVVSGDNGRLAVECDGRIAHLSPAQIRDDMERERELRRAGWKFWRVRESEFTFDPERALEPLWAELGRLSIYPGAQETTVGTAASAWTAIDLPDQEDEDPDGEDEND